MNLLKLLKVKKMIINLLKNMDSVMIILIKMIIGIFQ